MPPNAVLQRLVDERERVNENIDAILESAEGEDRDPSDSERELISRQRSRLAELEPQIGELLDLEEARQSSRDARAVLSRAGRPEPTPTSTPSAPESEGGELVYRNFGQYARDELISRFDSIATRAGGPSAREAARDRLTRAVANTLTADIPGLLPSQHLAQLIDVIDKSRPVVQASRSIALTAGKVTYPQITQRPIVGEQTAEKTELPSQKMTVAMREANAKVYGGSGDLSWQDVVWSNPDALALWFDLAAEAYAHTTEGVACAALEAIAGTAIPVASNDLAGWIAAITQAAGEIYDSSGRRADTLATDVATGYALLGIVGSEAPVFIAAGSGNLSTGTGTVAGLQLVISGGFTAPYAVVGAFDQFLTAENAGAPVELRAVEPSIAGFEVGVVGAFLAQVIDATAFRELGAPAVTGSSTRSTSSKSS
ncbi:MAG TPA: hypothetical protein VH482_38040 [Thermomicrobiales bacterium]|jgi:hypothetical protein